MNHLKFQDPMILRFERVYPSATPQQQCAAQKQDGATLNPLDALMEPDPYAEGTEAAIARAVKRRPRNAAAQSPDSARIGGEPTTRTTADAAAPLKPGDLVMAYHDHFAAWALVKHSFSEGRRRRNVGEVLTKEFPSREFYFDTWRLPTPEELAQHEGWITWSGGECPVPAGTRVEYKLRDGYSSRWRACEMNWSHDPTQLEARHQITAYRVLP